MTWIVWKTQLVDATSRRKAVEHRFHASPGEADQAQSFGPQKA